MAMDNMNLVLSLALLQGKGVEKGKMIAASVGAAMIPGMMGLALPLIVARNAGRGEGPGGGGAAGPVQTKVPDVQGKHESEALAAIKKAGLNPVISRAYFSPSDSAPAPAEGTVVSQAPKASSDWLDTGSDVFIEISLGAVSATVDNNDIELDIQKKVAALDQKLDQLLARSAGTTGGTGATGGTGGTLPDGSTGNQGKN